MTIVQDLKEIDLSVSDQYSDEGVCSDRVYPEEYTGPKPILDQVKTIAKIFDLDPSQALEFAKSLPTLPEGAEGWFAIPSVDALAKKRFLEVTDPAEMYCLAIQLVSALLDESRSFRGLLDEYVAPEYFRVHARTVRALDFVAKRQPGDILIIAAQLGLRHRGRSVRCAREAFAQNEFGLTTLIVGSIVLVHPERFSSTGGLCMDCSGDEFNDPDEVRFSSVPNFGFDEGAGTIDFDTERFDEAGDFFGSATGFLPPAT